MLFRPRVSGSSLEHILAVQCEVSHSEVPRLSGGDGQVGRQRGSNSAHALSQKSPTRQVLVFRVPEKTIQFHSTPACSAPSSPVREDLELSAIICTVNALNDYNEADVILNLKDEFKKQLESFLECQREVDGKLRERVGLIKNNGLSADQNLLKAARMETIKGKIKQKIKTHVNKLRAQGPGEGKCCQN